MSASRSDTSADDPATDGVVEVGIAGPWGVVMAAVAFDGMQPAALMPVKRFGAAKGRLTGHLTAAQRSRLARWLANRVAAAAAPLPLFIACDDEEVAGWADGIGAEVLWSAGLGLNGAVDSGRATITGKGFDHVVIVHSDLPLARDLATLVEPGTITLVPDRVRDGTNVMVLPSTADVSASYGARSFGAHFTAALATGLPTRVIDHPALSLDVDTPVHLAHPAIRAVLPDWLTD